MEARRCFVCFVSLKTTVSKIRNDWYTHCLRYCTLYYKVDWNYYVIFVYISAMRCNASHSSVSASGPLPWLELDPEGSLAVGGAVNLPPRVCSIGQSMTWCKKLKGPGHLQTPSVRWIGSIPKDLLMFKEVPTSLKKMWSTLTFMPRPNEQIPHQKCGSCCAEHRRFSCGWQPI